MNTVFVGGSRHVSRLPSQVKERLNNIIESGHRVVVGDANGADKAVQKHFVDADYGAVTVFCSGPSPRNNLGHWKIHSVVPPKSAKGFQFYAAKDREMAREADFGLMIWDGKSPGTVLNVLRLLQAGKKAVLMNLPDNKGTTFKSSTEWRDFLVACSPELRADLRDRALPNEWVIDEPAAQDDFFASEGALPVDDGDMETRPAPTHEVEEITATINAALASGDASRFIDALGTAARTQGMTQIAKETGLARESLYRSLGADGNPEFATVLKIIMAMGLRLQAGKAAFR